MNNEYPEEVELTVFESKEIEHEFDGEKISLRFQFLTNNGKKSPN